MTASLAERQIGSMPWLAVRGSRQACFRALGERAAATITDVVRSLPQLGALRRHVATAEGRSRFESVAEVTAARFPAHMDEMAALAAGAGVDAHTVVLLNLRGDLGDPHAGGCSDVLVPGARWVLGHNEDGDPRFAGRICGLTLAIDGEVPIFALWYPGMLPSNAFTLNAGAAWGVDHVPAAARTTGPARHVVARALQQCQELDAVAAFLAADTSAGGFAYNVAERRSGRVATVESGGGAGARPEEPAPGRALWHTNHLRYATAAGPPPGAPRCARGDVLAALADHAGGPLAADRVLDVLTTPLPNGVRADGTSVTLCTVVVDGSSGTVTFVPRGGRAGRVSVDDLLA